MASKLSAAVGTLLVAWLGLKVFRLFYNVFLHPLHTYPGPLAGRATDWYKTYIEVVKQENWTDLLIRSHKQFGEVIRIGPNELHFSNPRAYHDIYNSSSRWEKEKTLYECFGEDHSSFGFRTYAEAKQRKDVLQPLFSRRNILSMQSLVKKNMDHLVSKLAENNAAGKSSDLFFAFRCFTMDTVTTFCFAKSVNATDAPNFDAPIIQAMEASGPAFILFKHLPPLRKLIFSLPPNLAIKASPETAGLTRLQVMLKKQVDEVTANPASLKEAPHPIIYHRLLDPEAHKGQAVPNAQSLYEEAQALMFGGGDSVGNTLMVGFVHIFQQPDLYARLRSEVRTVWPNLSSAASFEVLETLPLLTATIKESLRISPGVISPLLRVVPPTGATIASQPIPGGTVVGISPFFVHQSATIFANPEVFDVSRWMSGAESKELEQWLVAFSRGPRSCLGINLAWCELYIAFATMLRVFEMEVDDDGGKRPADLRFRDAFLPFFYGEHLRAWCRPAKE